MDFPEFAINDESQRKFQLIISDILRHYKKEWRKNLHFRLFLWIDLFKKEAYRVMKILCNYNGLRSNNSILRLENCSFAVTRPWIYE